MSKIEIEMDEFGRVSKIDVKNLKGESCTDLTKNMLDKLKGSKVSVNTEKTCEFDEQPDSNTNEQLNWN